MAQNYEEFMSCVRSMLAEHRPQKTPPSSAANKATSTQHILNPRNESISTTPNNSAANKAIQSQSTEVLNYKTITPTTSQSSAANKATPTQSTMAQRYETISKATNILEANKAAIRSQIKEILNYKAITPTTSQSSAAIKATPTQSTMAQRYETISKATNSLAVLSQLDKVLNKDIIPMSLPSSAANKATPTQSTMNQKFEAIPMAHNSSATNKAVLSHLRKVLNEAIVPMNSQSSAANKATPPQLAKVKNNAPFVSMFPQRSAANEAIPTQTTMTQRNAAIIPTTPQSSAANEAIPPQLSNVESHAAKISILSDADLLAYTTAATIEILRRYAITPLSSAANNAIPHQPVMSQSNISTSSDPLSTPQNSEPVNVESHAANLSTLTNTQLSARFYIAAIKVLHRSKKALIAAAKEANPSQPTTTLSDAPLSGPEMLAWFIKANINVLLQLAIRLGTKFNIAIPSQSSIVQSNFPIAELLGYATAVTVEILQRKAKDQNGAADLSTSPSTSPTSQSTATVHSNLAYISIFSGPELLEYITAASIEVFQRNVRVLGNKILLPPPKTTHSNADNVLTIFRPEILTCFTESTMKFLQKSLKDFTASRKRSGETKNNGKGKTRRLSQAAASVDPQPSPQPESQQSTKSYPPVYGELTCSFCNNWMSEDQIKMCACKIICVSCASPLTKCEDCHITFEYDIRLVNFHQRIAKQIPRPCKYVRDGCTYVVKPGDQHETNCEYEPVACNKCYKSVSKALMGDHFEDVHFLGIKNLDVKLADFYLDAVGTRKIKVVTNEGLSLHILLTNVDGVDRFTVIYPVTDLNLRLRLHFNKDGYTYTRTDLKPLVCAAGERPTNTMFVDKNIFRDWVSGQNQLNIVVQGLEKPKGSFKYLHNRYLKKAERRANINKASWK